MSEKGEPKSLIGGFLKSFHISSKKGGNDTKNKKNSKNNNNNNPVRNSTPREIFRRQSSAHMSQQFNMTSFKVGEEVIDISELRKSYPDFHQVCDRRTARLIRDLVAHLLPISGSVEGIFRVPGSYAELQKLSERHIKGEVIDIKAEKYYPTTVADFLRRVLSKTTQPLIPRDQYAAFLKTHALRDTDMQIPWLRGLISSFPQENFLLLSIVSLLLYNIAQNEKDTKMGSYQLSLMMAPAVTHQSGIGNKLEFPVFELLISEYSSIFHPPDRVLFCLGTALEDSQGRNEFELTVSKGELVVIFSRKGYYFYGFCPKTDQFGQIDIYLVQLPKDFAEFQAEEFDEEDYYGHSTVEDFWIDAHNQWDDDSQIEMGTGFDEDEEGYGEEEEFGGEEYNEEGEYNENYQEEEYEEE